MKKLWIVPILLAMLVGALWYAQGSHLGTLAEKAIKTVEVDDFGDEVESVTWEKTLEIGLDVAVPAVGGFLLLGLGVFLLGHRERTRALFVPIVLGVLGLSGAVASLVVAHIG